MKTPMLLAIAMALSLTLFQGCSSDESADSVTADGVSFWKYAGAEFDPINGPVIVEDDDGPGGNNPPCNYSLDPFLYYSEYWPYGGMIIQDAHTNAACYRSCSLRQNGQLVGRGIHIFRTASSPDIVHTYTAPVLPSMLYTWKLNGNIISTERSCSFTYSDATPADGGDMPRLELVLQKETTPLYNATYVSYLYITIGLPPIQEDPPSD